MAISSNTLSVQKTKLAIVVSHPIQHFCPQYASLAANPALQVKVFFASALGYKKYLDKDFRQEIAWRTLHLDEFDHQFLNGELILPADKDLDAPGLEQALQAFGPDILIVYGYFQKFQRRAYRWARKNKIKLAYISDSERRQHRNFLKEWVKYPFVTRYFKGIDYFLSVGDANEEYYKHYGVPAVKIVRMHFSIDIGLYKKAYIGRTAWAVKLRAQFGLRQEDMVVSVVGKLIPRKNQVDIINAMKVLEDNGIHLHLFVIGSGETMEALQEKAACLSRSRVYFPGFTTPEELPGFYAASDIYIHPACEDAHPLAISEAIFMGCPVLISDKCGSFGPTDDVQDGKNGYIFRCSDTRDLADKIWLLTDMHKRQNFGDYSHSLGDKFQERAHAGFINELIEKIDA
jgi:glycosyltransferase involved in cell wall biosynthesis